MNKPKPTCPFSQAPCPQSVEHCPLWMPEGQCCALVAIALGLCLYQEARSHPQAVIAERPETAFLPDPIEFGARAWCDTGPGPSGPEEYC